MAENVKWFVVHTYSGYENKVQSNITTVVENRGMQDQIFEVRIPTEVVTTITEKKVKLVEICKKTGERKEITEIKLDGKGKKLPIVKKDINENGEGTIVVARENGELQEVTVRGIIIDEDDEEYANIVFEKEDVHKVFPGYVMIKVACVYKKKSEFEEAELSMSDEAWYVIRNTRGVTGFVGPGSKPVPLSDEEVIALGIEKRTVKVNYAVGDSVYIVSGPFDGYEGIVDSIDLEKKMVVVMISMLGRETPVELELSQVEVVGN